MPLSRSLARSFCSRLWRNGTILSKADLKKRRNLAIRAPLVESAVGEARKIDPARRKVISPRLKFKIVVLESLHYLSDEQTEYLIRDRLTFMCFLDLGVEDPVTDATTIWVSRDALAHAGLGEKLLTGGLHCARRPARRWLRLCNPSPSGKPRSPPSRRRCPPQTSLLMLESSGTCPVLGACTAASVASHSRISLCALSTSA